MEATEPPLVGEDSGPPSAVPVELAGPVDTREIPADFGSYWTVSFTGTEAPVQLLGEDPARAWALILVTGTGPVYVGSAAQCAAVKAGNPAGGGFPLPAGIPLPVHHKQPVWVVPDGTHTATVSVANERRRTP